MDEELNGTLQAIYDEHEQLTPELVVDIARNPGHPLHGRFTWDDGIAAEQWRRAEARGLIRTAKIVVHKDPDTYHKVRAFTSVISDGRRTYKPTADALADHRDQVLQQCLRDIASLREKYRALCDFDEALRQSLQTSAVA